MLTRMVNGSWSDVPKCVNRMLVVQEVNGAGRSNKNRCVSENFNSKTLVPSYVCNKFIYHAHVP